MPRITGSLDEGRITFGERTSTSDTKARDVVCGMLVDPARAGAMVAHEGASYFFCSERCKALFLADPGRYLASTPARADAP